jgi:hypothetical protein
MAPKLPGKFDDISKTAKSLLSDDFQTKGYQLKTKNKTQFHGATSELQVDLFGAGECKTPAKITFKVPKLFGIAGFAVDKFELDSKNAAKVETSLTNALHGIDGLKLEVKGDLTNQNVGATYTGVADTCIKAETKNFSPDEAQVEILRGVGDAVVGAKWNVKKTGMIPAVGVNYTAGPLFVSLFAAETFSVFIPHVHYKVSDDIKVAATVEFNQTNNKFSASAGADFKVAGVASKAKCDFKDAKTILSCAFKKDLAKGLTLNAGGTYGIDSGALGYGAKLSIE